MNFHPPKWSIYLGIAAFAVMFGVFIIVATTVESETIRKIFIKKQVEQAKEYKAESDSIKKAVVVKMDSIIQDAKQDSIHYVHEKESLRAVYKQNVKKYEAKILAVDSIPDDSVNGFGSIREMLCDSAVKVW